MRRVLVLALAALLWAPALVCAIGLGNIKTRSALNEPFRARIPLIHPTANELDSLKVQLADEARFQRAGVNLTSTLLKLRFKVKQSGKGPAYIEITSHDPIREPFLNFLLEIDWPNGRLIREYTVLLDPPFYGEKAKLALHPATTTAPAPKPAAAPKAPPPRPAPATPSVAAAATPSSSASAPPPAAASTDVSGGPVQAGDTAWSLAERMRPDQSVSIQQMMLALLRANPDAFVDGNVNGLKKGYVLKSPARGDITAVSREQALAEVRKQYAAWEQFREGMAKNVPTQPKGPVAQTGSGAPEAAPATAAPETDEAHLKLLSAKEGGAQAEVARQLAVAKETLDSKEQENADLKSQLVESEQIIEKLKSRVALQDDQLAALQEKLSSTPSQPAAAAPEAAKPAAAPAETTPPATPAPETKPAEVPKPAPAAKPKPARPAMPKPVAAAPKSLLDQATALVSKVIPKAVLETLPGGVLTVLGAVAVVLLGLIALVVKLIGRGGGESPAMPLPRAAPHAAAEEHEEADAVTRFDEPVTETREEEEPTVGAYEPGSTTQLEVTQIGGAQPSGEAGESEEDPLAEVNVYLAYERFDEAEKVVKDAIERYPDEQKYKLRLLEVYYSSNNKAAYEEAARALHDAVDGTGPLWDSAVAMWREMSPDRELFAASEADLATTAVDTTPERQFVDITADDEQPPEEMSSTVSTTLGEGEPPERTGDSAGGLDFDLGAAEEGESDEDVLDLTAGSDSDGVLDITAGESDEFLDLTAPSGEAAADFAPEEPTESPVPDLEQTVDRFATTTADDLLDVTKSGDLTADEHQELLNVTSPGASGDSGGESVLDITGGHEEPPSDNVIEFDLGGGLEETPAEMPEEGVFDITAGGAEADEGEPADETSTADSNMLEFDISALEPEADAESEGGTGTIPAVPASEMETLNFDETMEASSEDSAAASSEMETLNLDEVADASADSGEEASSIEEQLSAELESGEGLEIDLDDASLASLSEPSPDETMDLSTADLDQSMDDLSLDDLTKSLEDTLTGLQKSAEAEAQETPKDEFSLDLDAGGEQGDQVSAPETPELGGEPEQDEHLSTVEMEEPGVSDEDLNVEKTVVMPKQDVEMQSSDDEVDTKLNLAKAYIELGDVGGARTILNEVIAEGSTVQQEEAQKLLQDMG